MPAHRNTAGLLLALMILLAVLHGAWPLFPAWPSGLAAWLAGLFLWSRAPARQRAQVGILAGVGVGGLLWGWGHHESVEVLRLVDQNHALLAMLAAVSFLRLVSVPQARREARNPRGRLAYLRTLFGIHLFGAAINLSAVVIIGDRLARRETLDTRSAILFSRGFSSAALWSPFFAGMAVVLTFLPAAELPILIAVGMPLAALGLVYTYVEAAGWNCRALAAYRGYPIHFQSLWIPAALSACVLVTHQFLPALSVLTVITLLPPLLSTAVLWWREGLRRMGAEIRRHITCRLPEMYGELLLFLAAGVLTVGLSSVFRSFEWLPFFEITGTTASMTLVALVLLAASGVHPIISISALAAWLQPLDLDATILAMVFLMTWGIGVASSPLSATHLTMQGRYGIVSWRFFRWNLFYCLFMLVLGSLVLHVYARFT